MQDRNGMNAIMKKMYLPGDSRSTRGIMARGKPIYGSLTNAANPKKMNKKGAIQRAAMARYGQ